LAHVRRRAKVELFEAIRREDADRNLADILVGPRKSRLEGSILVTGSAGVVEMVGPATLEVFGRIRFNFAPGTWGLNGVAASSDGYIVVHRGPIPLQSGESSLVQCANANHPSAPSGSICGALSSEKR